MAEVCGGGFGGGDGFGGVGEATASKGRKAGGLGGFGGGGGGALGATWRALHNSSLRKLAQQPGPDATIVWSAADAWRPLQR